MKKAVHRISIKGICASAAVFLLAAAVMLCVLRPGVTGTAVRKVNELLDPNRNDNWAYAMGKILCIGDSLTEGTYFGAGMDGAAIEQNYPYYLGRMLNTEVVNAGVSGYSASDWYIEKAGDYDYTDYDTVIIWLGTNNGLTDTLDTDVDPFGGYNDFAETETGYYCRIIETVKDANPYARIVLMNIFATKGDVKTTNETINKIAAKYDLHVIDTKSLSMDKNTDLHAGLKNPHFGKGGNIAAARLIIRDMGNYFAERPLRCEYGVSTA